MYKDLSCLMCVSDHSRLFFISKQSCCFLSLFNRLERTPLGFIEIAEQKSPRDTTTSRQWSEKELRKCYKQSSFAKEYIRRGIISPLPYVQTQHMTRHSCHFDPLYQNLRTFYPKIAQLTVQEWLKRKCLVDTSLFWKKERWRNGREVTPSSITLCICCLCSEIRNQLSVVG